MDSEALTRRMARLTLRPEMDDESTSYLEATLEDSYAFFMEFTHRPEDPGEKADSLICEIAAFKIHSRGVEGVKRATDGGMSRMYHDDLPPEIRHRLISWRVFRGLKE